MQILGMCINQNNENKPATEQNTQTNTTVINDENTETKPICWTPEIRDLLLLQNARRNQSVLLCSCFLLSRENLSPTSMKTSAETIGVVPLWSCIFSRNFTVPSNSEGMAIRVCSKSAATITDSECIGRRNARVWL